MSATYGLDELQAQNEALAAAYQTLQQAKDEVERQLAACAARLRQANEALQAEIARRKEVEVALQEAQAKFHAIAHSANDAIIAADHEGCITFWSKGAQKIFGYSEVEVLGQPVSLLMPERHKPAHQQGVKRVRATGDTRLIGKTVELQGVRKDNREFPLELSLSTWLTAAGASFSGIIHDISERKETEKLLAEQDNVLQTLLAILPDHIYVKDTHNGHVINNIAHVRIWGENDSNGSSGSNGSHGHNGHHGSNGKAGFAHFSHEMAAQYYAREQEVMRTGQPLTKEEITVDPEGRKHWLLTTTVPLRDERGQITALVGVSRDITEYKQAEEEHNQFFALSLDLLAVAGLDGYLKEINPAWQKTLGYGKEDLLSRPFIELVHPADRAAVVAELEKLANGLDVIAFEVRFICADGTLRWMSWSVAPLLTRGLLYGIGRDITKRKLAEEEKARLLTAVSQQRAELHALATRLAEVQETERQQLARELHDQVGQNLSALGFNLNFIGTQLSTTSPQAAMLLNRLKDSLALVEQTTERVRNVMAELRPPMLDEYGLVDTLEWYADGFSTRSGVRLAVDLTAPNPRLAPSAENMLFRIAQEALTNVAKHAQATQVNLSLMVDDSADDPLIRMVIADNGVGLGMAASATKRPGLGLRLMAERAAMVGGRCWVEAHPGHGVRVVVEVKRS